MKRFLANVTLYLGLIALFTLPVAKTVAQEEERPYVFPFIGKISPSPDGRYIVFDFSFSDLEDHRKLCIVDVLTKEIYELLPEDYCGIDPNPAWSPDGSVIAFEAGKIYLIDPDGSNLRELTDFIAGYPVWSPDGNYLAVETKREGDFETGTDIMIIDRQGNEVAWLVTSPENERPIAWSPDNSYILFTRDVREGYITYEYQPLWRANIDMRKPFPAESSGIYRLTEWNSYVGSAAILPDASKILLPGQEGIWIMNADGSDKTLLIPKSVFPGEFSMHSVAWCPQINKIAVVAAELIYYNVHEGYDGPFNIYLINPDGTGLEQITFFTGISTSQAKALRFPLICELKNKLNVPVIAKGMNVKVKKEVKKVTKDEQELKLGIDSSNPHPLPLGEEHSTNSNNTPVFAGVLSLSALGYTLWKFFKILG